VHEIPPNGQGVLALIALGILSHFEMSALAPDSVDSAHLQIEALKLAFADAHAYVSDPATMDVRPTDLLDAGYLRHRAALIDPTRPR
jgi:gamma-glutamyltranspeptidase/glutathione hydrolase